MEETLVTLREFGMEQLPKLMIPVAVLIVGWLVAIVASWMIRGGLRRTNLDERIAKKVLGEKKAETIDTARWTGKIVYYVVLAFTLIAFLQVANLTAASGPIESMLGALLAFLPKLVGTGVILLVAWLTATLTRRLLSVLMKRFSIDSSLADKSVPEGEENDANVKPAPVGEAVAETGFWLVLLVFVPAILGTLEIGGLLGPVQGMVTEVLGFLPNLASAGMILLVGWIVARVAQRLSANLLSGVGMDRLSDRVGLAKALGQQSLSSVIGFVVYALILLPVAVATLSALQIEAVTAPASEMLQTFFSALPALFAAVLILVVAYIAARLLTSVVNRLLQGIGFDNVLSRLGIAQQKLGKRTPSTLVGGIVTIAVLLFAGVEAAKMLNLDIVAGLGNEFALLGGRVMLGLLVFGLGMYLANLAAHAVKESGITNNSLISTVTRVAILALAGAMSLRQMGIADEIIELTFGLTLGAVAVAMAIAFGLGGRESAARTLEELRGKLHGDAQVRPFERPPQTQRR